ncbi:MAG TPA: chorismate synthase [Sphingomonadales bacterium]|nr:chorismate synthase [Sphingomonadales bacterium]
MAFNVFGRLFRVTSFGEAHGPAVGCVVDGAPPGLALSASDIQPFLDERKPGTSRHVSQRRETDKVEILSGVFEGKTTGHPIALLIRNTDARSKDYEELKEKFRPGHADYTYTAKYGVRDWRGGGRASARETAARVAAGAIARKILKGVTFRSCLVQLGPMAVDRKHFDWDEVKKNPLFCPDKTSLAAWQDALGKIREEGDSCGGVVEMEIAGVPACLGAPVFAKLDQDLAGAMMSIPAAKGVEIGEGFNAANLKGSENNDQMAPGPDGKPRFLSNHSGGILGGISTGEPILLRVAFKPTSSIRKRQQTVDVKGEAFEISTTGRHDPCLAIRAVPVAEAMSALVLADHLLLHLRLKP